MSWIFNRMLRQRKWRSWVCVSPGAHHFVRLAGDLLSQELDRPVLGIVALLYEAILTCDFVARYRAWEDWEVLPTSDG